MFYVSMIRRDNFNHGILILGYGVNLLDRMFLLQSELYGIRNKYKPDWYFLKSA
jgi:hypothetical protein